MIIYKTENLINGKIYVGKDKNNNPKYIGSGKRLKDAIKHYGLKNFKKHIIEECESYIQMSEREIFWISKLNSKHPNGYNLTEGGDGGDTISKHPNKKKILEQKTQNIKNESNDYRLYKSIKNSKRMKKVWELWRKDSANLKKRNKKISDKQKGIKKPKEQVEKQRKSLIEGGKVRGINNPMFEKKHSDYSKSKISNSKKGKSRSAKSIKKQIKTVNKKPFIKCPHCGLVAKSSANMVRYHFNNCKQNIL